jgi:acetoin utilization protein AcuB
MFVRDYMSINPITVGPEDSVGDALKLMEQHSIRRLPVVSHGKIVGLVTNTDLLKASPSPATSLSIHEINYLYPKIKIREIMTKNVITVNPDTVIEAAAVKMREEKIGTLVVEQQGKLLGLITESDLFKAFIDVFGFDYAGARVAIEVEDDIGVLSKIAEVVSKLNINIISVAAVRTRDQAVNLILRLKTDDVEELRNKVAEMGYKLLD